MKKKIIVVARVSNGALVNSKPCHDCIKVLQRYKIHKVYYSVPGGFMVEKVSTMSNDHVTFGNRMIRKV